MGPWQCRGKVESSAFRIVSDLVILSLLAAIPSTGIVSQRAHPSRLPFGAQPRRGPDGTRSRCGETHSGMREWQPALGAHAESGTFYFAGTGTFYFAPTGAMKRSKAALEFGILRIRTIQEISVLWHKFAKYA